MFNFLKTTTILVLYHKKSNFQMYEIDAYFTCNLRNKGFGVCTF